VLDDFHGRCRTARIDSSARVNPAEDARGWKNRLGMGGPSGHPPEGSSQCDFWMFSVTVVVIPKELSSDAKGGNGKGGRGVF